jgi:hypothetical protein
MSEPDELNSAWGQVLNEYPRIGNWGIEVGRGPQARNTGGGHVEFYPPDEAYNPRPGKPYIEVYNNKAKGDELKGLLFGDALHYAHKADPKFNEYREQFRQALSPEQRALSQRRYRDYSNPQSKHYNGENRPYDDWFEQSDLDAIIRGYLANQWPAEVYHPKERVLLDSMRGYLRQKP